MDIVSKRVELAEVEGTLDEARERLALARAVAEQHAVDLHGGEDGLGKNQAARERVLTIILAKTEGDPFEAYRAEGAALRTLEHERARLRAEIDGFSDVERAKDRQARLVLASAISAAYPSPAAVALTPGASAAMAEGWLGERLASDPLRFAERAVRREHPDIIAEPVPVRAMGTKMDKAFEPACPICERKDCEHPEREQAATAQRLRLRGEPHMPFYVGGQCQRCGLGMDEHPAPVKAEGEVYDAHE